MKTFSILALSAFLAGCFSVSFSGTDGSYVQEASLKCDRGTYELTASGPNAALVFGHSEKNCALYVKAISVSGTSYVSEEENGCLMDVDHLCSFWIAETGAAIEAALSNPLPEELSSGSTIDVNIFEPQGEVDCNTFLCVAEADDGDAAKKDALKTFLATNKELLEKWSKKDAQGEYVLSDAEIATFKAAFAKFTELKLDPKKFKLSTMKNGSAWFESGKGRLIRVSPDPEKNSGDILLVGDDGSYMRNNAVGVSFGASLDGEKRIFSITNNPIPEGTPKEKYFSVYMGTQPMKIQRVDLNRGGDYGIETKALDGQVFYMWVEHTFNGRLQVRNVELSSNKKDWKVDFLLE